MHLRAQWQGSYLVNEDGVEETGPLWEMGHHKHSKMSCVCVPHSFSCVWIFLNPVDYSPPGSSVHEIFQARVLLQGIFPTQGSNPHLSRLLPWQVDSFLLAPPGHEDSQSFLEGYYIERGFRGYPGNGQDKPRRWFTVFVLGSLQ